MQETLTTKRGLAERAATLKALAGLPPEALLGPDEIAALTGYSAVTIRHCSGRFQRKLPPSIAGLKLRRWRLGDVLQWLRTL